MQIDEPSFSAFIAHSARLHPECSAGDWVTHRFTECTAKWPSAAMEDKADETCKRSAIPASRRSRVPAMGRWRKPNPWFYTIVGGFFVFALVIVGFYYG